MLYKKIIRNGKTTSLSTHQQLEAKNLKDQNTMLLFSCCCQQTMVSTSSQDTDSSLLTNSRWIYHQNWKEEHTKGIIFLYVDPILGWKHHEEVVWITTVLEILALSIIKAQWLHHGPCQYIQHTSTIYMFSTEWQPPGHYSASKWGMCSIGNRLITSPWWWREHFISNFFATQTTFTWCHHPTKGATLASKCHQRQKSLIIKTV